MAKKSKIAKAKKQQAMIAKYAPIRQALKEAGDYEGLSKLPKDAHPSRSAIKQMGAHVATCVNLACLGFVSVNWLTKA